MVETTSPFVGDLVRTVKISGKVTPRQSVDLGFEIAGTVASISKKVGQSVSRGELLAKIDTNTISTEILKAQADLTLAQANLAKLDGAGIYEAQIENAKRTLIQTIIEAYAASEDAIHNKTDSVFLNPRSSRPEMVYAFEDHFDLRDSIIQTRVTMDEKLDGWKLLTTGLTASTYTEDHLTKSKQYLSDISLYIASVAQAVNVFKASSSLSQTNIDTYKSNALSARDSVNSSSQSLITAEDKLRGFLLEVPVQVARVESARATLLNHQSQLTKTSLLSPMSGVVSRQDAKVGQVVSTATSLISVISQELEVEAYVPEVLISGVRVANPAGITLDAYGSDILFEATLEHIDPAETIRDGVSTYKVRLLFNNPDGRIKPGMTANIDIETLRKPGVRLLLERALLREKDGTYLYILTGDKTREKILVETGERDSVGHVELLSDLPEDSKIIVNPTES